MAIDCESVAGVQSPILGKTSRTLTVAQSIPSTTFTNVDFDTLRFNEPSPNPDITWDSLGNRFEINTEGTYVVNTTVFLESLLAINAILQVVHQPSGSPDVTYDQDVHRINVLSLASSLQGVAQIECGAGDYIAIRIWHDSILPIQILEINLFPVSNVLTSHCEISRIL